MQNLFILCAAFLLFSMGAKADNERTKDPENPVDSQFVWQKSLDEVVVTGQGSAVSKRRLSSNITKLSADDLKLFPTDRIDQMLQNAVPNMQITLTTGQPGTLPS